MNKENYPTVIFYDSDLKYDSINFDGSESYAEDYKQACAYAKKNGGVVYTVVDGYGSTVDFFKDSVRCDRLGYVVVKIKELKGGIKTNGK